MAGGAAVGAAVGAAKGVAKGLIMEAAGPGMLNILRPCELSVRCACEAAADPADEAVGAADTAAGSVTEAGLEAGVLTGAADAEAGTVAGAAADATVILAAAGAAGNGLAALAGTAAGAFTPGVTVCTAIGCGSAPVKPADAG